MKRQKNTFRRLTSILFICAIILIAILIIRTVTYPFAKNGPIESVPTTQTDVSEKALQRLAGGIQIPTVSELASLKENNPFDEFKQYLPKVYPAIYANMDTLTINKYGLVFRWKGKNPSLNPILFCSHYDVVPVIGYEAEKIASENIIFNPNDTPLPPLDHTPKQWDHHPFSGAVTGGRIYGRGTLDMKNMLFGIMEAADLLLENGFIPERDIWFAFGFDEEIGGTEGALKIAQFFKDKGLTFDAVYDEGGVVSAPGLGGIDQAIALIGTAEKGFLTLYIKVHGIGGHSSMPPAKGALVLAAEIIEKLNSQQMPLTLIPPISAFLDNVGGTMGLGARMAIANKWLLGDMLLKNLAKVPVTNALTRTTIAITMAKGSDAPNVLASVAEITVNFRILTGESVADVVKHVEKICEGYETEITIESSREPSRNSDMDARGFKIIGESLSHLYPEALVTPYLTIGGTDSYKYEAVSNYVYRFMPVYINEHEQRIIHNENEFITIDNYKKIIAHFKYIMENF